jgi:hypothetical protein
MVFISGCWLCAAVEGRQVFVFFAFAKLEKVRGRFLIRHDELEIRHWCLLERGDALKVSAICCANLVAGCSKV